MRRLRRLARLLAGPAGRGPAVALAVIAALGAFLATAGPRESAALQNAALHKTLAGFAAGVGLYATADWDMTGTTPTDLLSPQQLQTAGHVLRSYLAPPLKPAPGAADWNGLTSPLIGVTDAAKSAFLGEPPQLELGYRSALAANARLVAGTYPYSATLKAPGRLSVTLQVAVTTATAARFSLHPGSMLDLAAVGNGNGAGPPVTLDVTGIIRPDHPGIGLLGVRRGDRPAVHPGAVLAGRSAARPERAERPPDSSPAADHAGRVGHPGGRQPPHRGPGTRRDERADGDRGQQRGAAGRAGLACAAGRRTVALPRGARHPAGLLGRAGRRGIPSTRCWSTGCSPWP